MDERRIQKKGGRTAGRKPQSENCKVALGA